MELQIRDGSKPLYMKRSNPAGVLSRLRDTNPARFISLVRLAWPDIKAALDRGHSIKVVHDHFVKGGVRISYRLFAMYVGQLRREDPDRAHSRRIDSEFPVDEMFTNRRLGPSNIKNPEPVALVRVPKRRLLSAKAAAQYLGIHEQTLKKSRCLDR